MCGQTHRSRGLGEPRIICDRQSIENNLWQSKQKRRNIVWVKLICLQPTPPPTSAHLPLPTHSLRLISPSPPPPPIYSACGYATFSGCVEFLNLANPSREWYRGWLLSKIFIPKLTAAMKPRVVTTDSSEAIYFLNCYGAALGWNRKSNAIKWIAHSTSNMVGFWYPAQLMWPLSASHHKISLTNQLSLINQLTNELLYCAY